MRGQIVWIESREQALTAAKATPLPKVGLADVLRDIVPVVFPSAPERRGGLRAAWNVLSSDAHALYWEMESRAIFQPANRTTGLSTGFLSGRIDELAG